MQIELCADHLARLAALLAADGCPHCATLAALLRARGVGADKMTGIYIRALATACGHAAAGEQDGQIVALLPRWAEQYAEVSKN